MTYDSWNRVLVVEKKLGHLTDSVNDKSTVSSSSKCDSFLGGVNVLNKVMKVSISEELRELDFDSFSKIFGRWVFILGIRDGNRLIRSNMASEPALLNHFSFSKSLLITGIIGDKEYSSRFRQILVTLLNSMSS